MWTLSCASRPGAGSAETGVRVEPGRSWPRPVPGRRLPTVAEDRRAPQALSEEEVRVGP